MASQHAQGQLVTSKLTSGINTYIMSIHTGIGQYIQHSGAPGGAVG